MLSNCATSSPTLTYLGSESLDEIGVYVEIVLFNLVLFIVYLILGEGKDH